MLSSKKDIFQTLNYINCLICRSHKKYYFLFITKIALESISTLINIILGRYLILFLTTTNQTSFIQLAWKLVFINLILSVCLNVVTHYLDSINNDLQLYMEETLSQKTLKLKYAVVETSYYRDQLEKAKVGISWYSGGIAALSHNINKLLSHVVMAIGTLGIISQLSHFVLCIILLSSIITVFITALSQKRDAIFRKRLVSVNRKLGYYLNLFKDYRIAKDARVYQALELIETRVNTFLDTEWKLERNRTKFGNKIRVWIDVVNYLNQSILYAYFAWQVIQNQIDVSAFTMYISAGISFYNNIVNITTQYIETDKNISFIACYVNFIKAPEQKTIMQQALLENPYDATMIEFQNVWFKYPQSQHYVLKDISFVIKPSEKIALVGPNGAGKTTIIKLLCKLYTPSSGTILLNGKNIENYSDETYCRLLSSVFQDFKFFPFTIRENLMSEKLSDIWESLRKATLDQRISSLPLNLDTPITKMFDENGVDLSGGELQKLAIARSFCKKTPIVFFDEPTAALDPVAEFDIFRIFTQFVQNQTVIIISHRMAACPLCDRIVVIDNGIISEIGTHQELLSNSHIYKRMWDAQAQYYL